MRPGRGGRALAAAGALLLVALLAAAAGEPATIPALKPDGEPLRDAFNREAGRVRLILFIDPT